MYREKMMRFLRLLILVLLACGIAPEQASAQNKHNYILQSPSLAQAQAACQTYGMVLVNTIRTPDTYLVQVSSAIPPNVLQKWVEHDLNVQHLELDNKVSAPETTTTVAPYIPSLPATSYVTADPFVRLYGSNVWLGYVQQPAMYSTNAADTVAHNVTGSSIVAVIDTGVDPTSRVLAPVLVSGYDFVHNVDGVASEYGDVDQSTAHILHQSTAHILHDFQTMQLNNTTVGLLDSNTAVSLQGASIPSDFGHGTMVAGLIHLVAPTAKIMPIKAFQSDGTANLSDVIRAIYFAADHGARVINMSFGFPQISDTLMQAVNYATRKGVICVASVGNDGQNVLVYPAAYGNVIAVASVSQQNQISTFSNYGPDLVTIAAPGEALVTIYPGDHYAAVWGTSFSSALVSGAAIDMLSFVDPHISPLLGVGDVRRALSHTIACDTSGNLGAGCIDLDQAVQFLKGTNVPH
jgi:subtilisin family serine protease